MAKQPDDLIVIRGLKGRANVTDIDLADEEINEAPLKRVGDEKDFVQKLSQLVQLTGYSDPIYAEAFVNIHKFDISFDVLLVNRSPKALLNIYVEFFTQGDHKVLEKAHPVTLQPAQSAKVATSIKFSS